MLHFWNNLNDIFKEWGFSYCFRYLTTVIIKVFSIKIFYIEFLPDLYVLRCPESKKADFENWSERRWVPVFANRMSNAMFIVLKIKVCAVLIYSYTQYSIFPLYSKILRNSLLSLYRLHHVQIAGFQKTSVIKMLEVFHFPSLPPPLHMFLI